MDALFLDIARSVAGSRTAEELTRNLLVILEKATGLDSIYLTRVDPEKRRSEVAYARNVQPEGNSVPEGLDIPWQDAICRRALGEGVRFTQGAHERWPDLQALHDLKIDTYIVEPVEDAEGLFLGTLCAISHRRLPVAEELLPAFTLCARLVADQITRDRKNAGAPAGHGVDDDPPTRALFDPLTGLANRHGLVDEIGRALKRAAREGGRVCVAYVGLDAFEAINDAHGHELGDGLLVAVAERLAAAAREGEFVGRHGGGEFVAIARVPERAGGDAEQAFRERLAEVTRGPFLAGTDPVVLDGAEASVGTAVSRVGDTPLALLQRAAEAMFGARQAKAVRAAAQGASPGIARDDSPTPT